ncbi:MAG: aminoglycoside phosphotransferase [Actinobacteria bacterium]|nr:MAG: aminoglycoside phosphotransferase [Actinomycetota bacterium]
MTSTHAEELAGYLAPFLERQRWFARSEREDTGPPVIVEAEVLRPGRPGLTDLVVAAGDATYHVLVGVREEQEALGLLRGQEHAILGPLEEADGHSLAYGALADPELALLLLEIVSGGRQQAARVRSVGAEQSNTSMVYDDRLIMKLFRRLQPGPNPDVEVTLALDEVGFNHVAAPVAVWRRDPWDLALVQEFLAGGSEGWALALTSLRDLYASDPDTAPEAAGGDFGDEARRLGEMTAKLHIALAEAFGRHPSQPDEWARSIQHQLDAVPPSEGVTGPGVGRILDDLRAVGDPGLAIRLHGDYHLGQVMRGEVGWYVLDFEGEPARPLAERREVRSPLRDVAGMLRSFQYATALAAEERGPAGQADVAGLAVAWEQRNRRAFLDGYGSVGQLSELVPSGPDFEVVLAAFELEKAAYELCYELAYRPAWAHIPRQALDRLRGEA